MAAAAASYWLVAVAALLIVPLVILLHYEVLRGCARFLPRITHRRRRRVLAVIVVVLLAHGIAMTLFAGAYAVLLRDDGLGQITGTSGTLADYVYFSAMVYTTVGFGDVVPAGPIRMLAAVEAITGLVMITWSASFTFLEMQRDWRERTHRRHST